MDVADELSRARVLDTDVRKNFNSLDHNVKTTTKIRYLIQNILEKVEGDERVFDRLIEILYYLGYEGRALCEIMRKELSRDVEGDGSDVFLKGEDVRILIEDFLIDVSHKWEEIGLAIGLPHHVRNDCGKGSSNPVRLSNILTAWIKDGHGSGLATLCNLKAALCGNTVGLKTLALTLDNFKIVSSSIPDSSQLNSDCRPEIVYDLIDTEVAEGKSTLLDIQVSSNIPVNYQWKKDGKIISDASTYSGISSAILFVAKASLRTEGEYSCSVTCGSIKLSSTVSNLTVKLPLEKDLLVKSYLDRHKLLSQELWPPVCKNMFHTPVLHKKIEHKEEYVTITGEIDKLLDDKEKTSYEETFNVLERGCLVVVEGRPGSGKTTLVHKLVMDWATGNPVLLNSKLVFLLNLRTLKISNNIFDWLSIYYSDSDFCAKVVTDINISNGENYYFILDGLDECPFRNEEDSFIHKLLYKKYLPSSVIILTSRPIALTNELRNSSSKSIEVIGFTKELIFKYINNYPFQRLNSSSDNNMASQLTEYVRKHVNMLQMCYLPLHAAIICYLFDKLEDNVPNRETQIYEQFVIATILRNMKREKKQILPIRSLKALDGNVMKNFLKVCCLAFNMTFKSSPVLFDSNESFLGLVTVQPTSKHYGVGILHAFHHLSIQEYLAAYHITELEEYEQDVVLTAYGENIYSQNVWKFYIGIDKYKYTFNKFSRILLATNSDCLSAIRYAFESEEPSVCNYVAVKFNMGTLFFDSVSLAPTDFSAINYVVLLSFCRVSKLKFRNCKFDKESVEALTGDTFEFVSQCIYSKNNFGLYDSEALNILLSKLLHLEVLDLRHTDLNEVTIKAVTKNVVLPRLRILKINESLNYLPPEILRLLTFQSKNIEKVFIQWSSIRQLSLTRNAVCQSFKFQAYSGANYPSLYLYNHLKCLPSFSNDLFKTYVDIALVNCGVDDNLAKLLADGCSNSPCLISMELDFNRISDSGAKALSSCVATLTKISVLSLQCNSIGDSGAKALANSIVQRCTLRRFDLQGNNLSIEGAVAVAETTHQLSQLKVYLCNVGLTKEDVRKVLECNKNACVEETITNSFSWKAVAENGEKNLMLALKNGKCPILKFSGCSLSKVEAFLKEVCLEQLKIFHFTSSYSTIENLNEVMTYIRNIEHLHLCLFKFFDDTPKLMQDDGEDFIFAIRGCHNLHTLSLSSNNIGSKYVTKLFQAIQNFCHLKELDLSHNCIREVYLDDLHCCNNLIKLDLSCNKMVLCSSPNIIRGITIQQLNLSDNELNQCIDQLNQLLVKCSNLHCLNLSGNCLSTGVADLVDVLKCSMTLRDLKLGNNKLESEGASAVASIIRHNFNLEVVDLSNNKITANETDVFSEAFRGCTNLLSINFSNNPVSSEGMSCLLDSFRCCTKLCSLNLKNTGLDQNGATVLDNFQCGINLQELDLSFNMFSSSNIHASLVELQYHDQLPEELLQSINFESYGFDYLAKALNFCLNLKHLYLAGIDVNKNGIELIVNSLKHCHTLEYLDLSCNPSIGSEGAAILVEGLQRQSELTLDLKDSIVSDCKDALLNGEPCCSSCKKLLLIYYTHDTLLLLISEEQNIPKLVSKMEI